MMSRLAGFRHFAAGFVVALRSDGLGFRRFNIAMGTGVEMKAFLAAVAIVAGFSSAAEASITYSIEGDIEVYSVGGDLTAFGIAGTTGRFKMAITFADDVADNGVYEVHSNYEAKTFAYEYVDWELGTESWRYTSSDYAQELTVQNGFPGHAGADRFSLSMYEFATPNGTIMSFVDIILRNSDNSLFTNAEFYNLAKTANFPNTPSNNMGYMIFYDGEYRDADLYFDFSTVSIKPPIAGIPEPATWLMMIMGFGLAGLAVRRRGRQLSIG
ncbi:PEPxxWA-CTERM sorting domain-containing protein [Gimibacter soli]|uniref:PEPxxWA-CTERM sorting domain-containing protein n=1 Tax=Gimibacter soli TaxID=3024400 RepID=A0AAE9XUU9_9PROT|nr:PEPxxWA-CTERM sorting domain-containing protein [Gimibacter soli]WCL54078.1 PEPxxWA-CTERM sorting domain-containing protein [Gimibacter soli]